MKPRIVIEYPATGATYSHDEYGVYEYGEYPRGSVLEGQERRSFLDSFDDLDEAQAAYPGAEWRGEASTGYVDRPLPVDPPAWFDPTAIGETWADPDNIDLERQGLY